MRAAGDREVRDGGTGGNLESARRAARWSALYSASHWHSLLEPRLVLRVRAKESNNQKVWRGIIGYGDSMILAGAHIFAICSLVVSSAYFRKLAHSAGVRNANFRKHAP